ncbi:DUF397 domain-containing protein [Streptomyces fagopyri]|uniref:DUF397 domain-containing protein n=1 Tax=Streptomyces fagopyri TaxID=2662397 RepID=A0A5Q0LGJ3_9ACTN|nr:DUF397 domain-containing protein [Streptomyces fagopyri]QFZ76128.1 DUF397 domain-containing protein [Streptomyces fagopyri]
MSVSLQPASEPAWFKSSYSGGNTTECVEASFKPSAVLIRDSKHTGGPIVAVSTAVWHAFIRHVPERGATEPTK